MFHHQLKRSFRHTWALATLAALLAALLGMQTAAQAAPPCDDREYLRLVDRMHPLAAEYAPADLVDLRRLGVPIIGYSTQMRAEPAQAYARMARAAVHAGLPLIAISGYRSFAMQRYTFSRWMLREQAAWAEAGAPIDNTEATARANRYSAMAGQSEHQLGSALDVSSREMGAALNIYLLNTETGKWLLAHAHDYGFVLSYPPGKERLTGYNAEPWHLRFAGISAARELFDQKYLDPQNDVTLNGYLATLKASDCTAFLP